MATDPERKTALAYSAGMHVALLLFAIFGLPAIFEMNRDPEPMAISVEILPIAAISNVKMSQARPKELEKPKEPETQKEEPKPLEEAEKPKEKPVPPTKKEEKTLDEILKLSEQAEEKKKPEEKKKEKQKKVEDDLDAILKSVEKQANKSDASEKAEKKEESSEESQSKSENYNPDLPLSISEMDMIRSQLAKCWNVPAGAKDAETLVVKVKATFNADGSVIEAKLAPGQSRGDGYFRAAAESAVRAVYKCSPLRNLPADKYQTWKDMELTFDPKTMLY